MDIFDNPQPDNTKLSTLEKTRWHDVLADTKSGQMCWDMWRQGMLLNLDENNQLFLQSAKYILRKELKMDVSAARSQLWLSDDNGTEPSSFHNPFEAGKLWEDRRQFWADQEEPSSAWAWFGMMMLRLPERTLVEDNALFPILRVSAGSMHLSPSQAVGRDSVLDLALGMPQIKKLIEKDCSLVARTTSISQSLGRKKEMQHQCSWVVAAVATGNIRVVSLLQKHGFLWTHQQERLSSGMNICPEMACWLANNATHLGKDPQARMDILELYIHQDDRSRLERIWLAQQTQEMSDTKEPKQLGRKM